MEKKIIHKDVVIIGAGMAGLTAALYAGRLNLSVLVLEMALWADKLQMRRALRIIPVLWKCPGGS